MNPEAAPETFEAQTDTLESMEKIDSVWYPKYLEAIKEAGLAPDDKEAKAKVAESKEAFLRGEIETPLIENRKFNLDKISAKEQELLDLKQEIVAAETGKGPEREAVMWGYRWRINEKIAKLRILRAAATGDMRRYARYTDYVFGSPEKEVFDDAIFALRETVTRHLEAEDETEREAAHFLMENLLSGIPMTEERPVTTPSPEEFEQVRDKARADYDNFGIEVDESIESVPADRLAEMFETAISAIGADKAGYTVRVDEETSRPVLMVKKAKREMNIPAQFKTFITRAKELVNHETNHIDRRIQGERSRFLLLGDGFDRYDIGEEGLGTMQEEAFKEDFTDFPRLDYFLASALPYGMDGNPRNFKQVFDILDNYYTLFFIEEGQTKPEDLKSKAQKRAWGRAVNVFKGTDMKTPGVCNTRGSIYRRGNIAIWNLITNDGREMTKFTLGEYNRGKYDPANRRHLWLLTQAGISDEDLAETI